MKAKRQNILSICLVCLAVLSIAAFVLRFAAPNPTQRWYSSEYVDLSLQPRVYGLRAEEILGDDLDLPQNDSAEGERVCFCSTTYTAPAGRCNMCIVETANISTWSIPDFISPDGRLARRLGFLPQTGTADALTRGGPSGPTLEKPTVPAQVP